jgi:hypothetical protein
MTALSENDVLMYVESEDIIRQILPPESQGEALRGFREMGSFACPIPEGWGYQGQGSYFTTSHSEYQPIKGKEVPAAEAQAIDRARAAVHERGKTLHIVDVGKESALRRVIEEHLHHLHNFPVLVRVDGRRLEGTESFTKENLEKFLSD